MRKKTIIYFLLFTFRIIQCQTDQPEIISASGDFFKNSNASLSWTVGECLIETFITNDAVITQGFHQVYDVITADNNFYFDNIQVNVFPVPAKDFINVCFDNQGIAKIYFIELLDLQGKVLYNNQIDTDEAQLDVSQYTEGIYLLKVTDCQQKKSQNFKIQKVN